MYDFVTTDLSDETFAELSAGLTSESDISSSESSSLPGAYPFRLGQHQAHFHDSLEGSFGNFRRHRHYYRGGMGNQFLHCQSGESQEKQSFNARGQRACRGDDRGADGQKRG